MLLMIDNYDSFTYNLVHFLGELGAETQVYRNDKVTVDEVLAVAAARLEEGDMLTPVNDNARYYYELALSNDPGNTAARQGLDVIASKLVLEARVEIDDGNLNAAEGLLDDARYINASSSELAAATSALIAARNAVAERERLAAADRQREEAERIAAEERAEAERQAAAEAEAAAAAQAAADNAATEPLPAAANEAEQQALASAEGTGTQAEPEQAAQVESAEEPPADDGGQARPGQRGRSSTARYRTRLAATFS